jgi:hypothetical protein
MSSYIDYNENLETTDPMLDETLYARRAELKSLEDLKSQRGTPIPALYNQFYRFIQNPSSVSVETFKRMIDTDDTIGSGIDFLTTALSSRLGIYQHPSKEVTDFVNKALQNIEGGFYNVVKELLSATWAGFAVQEIVWENNSKGFMPKKMVPLPPSTLLFETERTGEITSDGILQYQRNYNPALSGGVAYLFGFNTASGLQSQPVRPDPFAKLGDFPYPLRTANVYSYLAIRIPRDKCLHYAFDAQGKFASPYGRSLLRRAYKYYVLKDAILNMMATALDRKGTPLLIVYADGQKTVLDSNKYTGEDNRGRRDRGIRADVAASHLFRNIHNDTTIILPGRKDDVYGIEQIQQASNAGDFIQAIELCNKSIMRALLIPSLIFMGGDGSGAYALGQEHAKTFDKICDGMLEGLKQSILTQLIKQIIAYNFPMESWAEYGLGDFSKRTLTQDEIEKELGAIERAVNIGAIDMNDSQDLNTVREKIGMTPLSNEQMLAKQAAMQQNSVFGGGQYAGSEADQSGAVQGQENFNLRSF